MARVPHLDKYGWLMYKPIKQTVEIPDTIVMEERVCKCGCGKKFKVSSNSDQTHVNYGHQYSKLSNRLKQKVCGYRRIA